MKRIGLIVLLVGALGFFLSSAEARTPEAAASRALLQEPTQPLLDWGNARWLSVGTAIFGLTLLLAPDDLKRKRQEPRSQHERP